MNRRDDSDQSDASSDSTGSDQHRLSDELFDETMGPGSAMAHLYRGEIHRMELWRGRLDRTTYWAVTIIAAILTWAFSSRDNPHYLILMESQSSPCSSSSRPVGSGDTISGARASG